VGYTIAIAIAKFKRAALDYYLQTSVKSSQVAFNKTSDNRTSFTSTYEWK